MFMDISVKTMLETRQEACKYLSNILGTEVTCELKYDYKKYEEKIEDAIETEEVTE